jgi:hypothetical protein
LGERALVPTDRVFKYSDDNSFLRLFGSAITLGKIGDVDPRHGQRRDTVANSGEVIPILAVPVKLLRVAVRGSTMIVAMMVDANAFYTLYRSMPYKGYGFGLLAGAL